MVINVEFVVIMCAKRIPLSGLSLLYQLIPMHWFPIVDMNIGPNLVVATSSNGLVAEIN